MWPWQEWRGGRELSLLINNIGIIIGRLASSPASSCKPIPSIQLSTHSYGVGLAEYILPGEWTGSRSERLNAFYSWNRGAAAGCFRLGMKNKLKPMGWKIGSLSIWSTQNRILHNVAGVLFQCRREMILQSVLSDAFSDQSFNITKASLVTLGMEEKVLQDWGCYLQGFMFVQFS